MDKKQLLLTVVPGAAFGISIWMFRGSIHAWWQIFGVCLLVVGFVLWTIARFQLGASFSVTAQARRLVTHGLYSKVRNPIYIFGSWVIAGAFLAAGHPIWLLIFIIVIPMQIWRARKEAAVLEAKFGEEYRAYRASTWF
ncbi:MAG TPA: isoprenylcysteine carboxylmethyltransferase family protein [Terriglobales bacterium]|nr:isoprenylcysteine carboxylmethyltransferase family protein [Terriglobales bacterium]